MAAALLGRERQPSPLDLVVAEEEARVVMAAVAVHRAQIHPLVKEAAAAEAGHIIFILPEQIMQAQQAEQLLYLTQPEQRLRILVTQIIRLACRQPAMVEMAALSLLVRWASRAAW